VEAACLGRFDLSLLQTVDWSTTTITAESEGPERRADSVQYRAISLLEEDYDVVFNDDGKGEAADIIALRQNGEAGIHLHLVHCKYSSAASPGSRVGDFYEVCGQAQKSIHWKHGGLRELRLHMLNRESKWAAHGHTRFVKGNMSTVRTFEKLGRRTRLCLSVCIVQPGLSLKRVSDPILQLLGSTDLFLKRTADAELSVFCST
jgi:hypothetical protein